MYTFQVGNSWVIISLHLAKYIMENGWIKDKCVLFGLETVRLPDRIIRLL